MSLYSLILLFQGDRSIWSRVGMRGGGDFIKCPVVVMFTGDVVCVLISLSMSFIRSIVVWLTLVREFDF